MSLNKFTHCGQTDTPAAVVGVIATFGLIILFENVFKFFLSYTNAVVANFKFEKDIICLALLNRSEDVNLSTIVGIFYSVRQQIVEYALKISCREPYIFTVVLRDCLNGDTLFLRSFIEILCHCLYESQRIIILQEQLEITGFDTIESYQFVDKADHPIGICDCHSEVLI